jgi:hypothetical protein
VAALRDLPVGPEMFGTLDGLDGVLVSRPEDVAALAAWIVHVADREDTLGRCPHVELAR